MSDINISGLDKADVLTALYNDAQPQGMGFLQATPESMTKDEARETLDKNQSMRFDYLKGRVLKVDISEDTFYAGLYDRDNGPGAAAAALQKAGLIDA